jgi:flavin reductase (DIM6/NTAB) family NADH-FMN oxidoreductase RutF
MTTLTPAGSAHADREAFINAMRVVANTVSVVTTDGPAGRHGATVSAFSSVSADPPTLLVCLHAASRIAGLVVGNGRFCVNVLDQASTRIADRFAGRHDDAVDDRFEGIALDNAPGLPPLIRHATAFSCRVGNLVQSGSHLVVFGQVETVRAGDPVPLAYLAGSYHRVVPHSGAGQLPCQASFPREQGS